MDDQLRPAIKGNICCELIYSDIFMVSSSDWLVPLFSFKKVIDSTNDWSNILSSYGDTQHIGGKRDEVDVMNVEETF